jgi:hypothetical protein
MKRKIDPEQPYVGTYRLGATNVEVFGWTHGFGGQFFCTPDDNALPRLKVSFLRDYWWEVVAVVMHESFEYLTCQRGVRYLPCGDAIHASDVYWFGFDHNAMSQMIADQGYFLAKCLPDLAGAWKKYKPKK